MNKVAHIQNPLIHFLAGLKINISSSLEPERVSETFEELKFGVCYKILGQAKDGENGSKILSVGSFWIHNWPHRRDANPKIEEEQQSDYPEPSHRTKARLGSTQILYFEFPPLLVERNAELFAFIGPCHTFLIDCGAKDERCMHRGYALRLAGRHLLLK